MRKLSLAISHFLQRADMLLLALCSAATIFGIVVVSSTTAYMGAGHFVLVQSLALVIGIILYIFFTLVDIDIIAEQID